MANQRWVGLASALIILGGALYLGGRGGVPDIADSGGSAGDFTAENTGDGAESVSDHSSPRPSATTATASASDMDTAADVPVTHSSDAPLEFPTLEKIRAETADNPHATPPSLIQFARDLAPRMEEALSTQDPRVVRRMVFALKACALSDSKNALPQVQAMCISNWKRVVEAREKEVPGLSDEWKRSENLLPQEARRLIDASNAMLKPSGEQ